MVDFPKVTLPLEDWYSFTIGLPEGLSVNGVQALEVVPKKRYDALVKELSETTINLGMHWMSRDLKTDAPTGVKWLFVRCANGLITSGYYHKETWYVYNPRKDDYEQEETVNPVTHYCVQPSIRPWNSK